MITAENVRCIFDYCQKTGNLIWKEGGSIRSGSVAGCVRIGRGRKSNYKQIKYKGRCYLNHRLVWLYHRGYWPDVIDHINHNGEDNRIENLRSISNAENQRNRGSIKDNKTGIFGVRWCKIKKHYRIGIGQKLLACKVDFFEACCIRKSAELKYGYHENHGR